MATTIRLPQQLEVEARAYADKLGLSLNALVAVSLADYLRVRDGSANALPAQPVTMAEPLSVRSSVPSSTPTSGTEGRARNLAARGSVSSVRLSPPVGGVYALCPCGSGKKWKFCHGSKS